MRDHFIIAECHLKATEIQLGSKSDMDGKTIHPFPPVPSSLSFLIHRVKSEMTF